MLLAFASTAVRAWTFPFRLLPALCFRRKLAFAAVSSTPWHPFPRHNMKLSLLQMSTNPDLILCSPAPPLPHHRRANQQSSKRGRDGIISRRCDCEAICIHLRLPWFLFFFLFYLLLVFSYTSSIPPIRNVSVTDRRKASWLINYS